MYDSAGGSLKLKGVSDKKIKKKKSKSSLKEVGQAKNLIKADTESELVKKVELELAAGTVTKPMKTKAELAYEKYNQKRMEEKILSRAEKSHKEHVENYNRNLDNLSEYNDIPKVSWTK